MLAAQQNGVSKVEALAGVDESLKGEAGVGSNPTAFIQIKFEAIMNDRVVARYKNIGVIQSHLEGIYNHEGELEKVIRHYSFWLCNSQKKIWTPKGYVSYVGGYGGFTSVVKAHRAMKKMYLTGKEPF